MLQPWSPSPLLAPPGPHLTQRSKEGACFGQGTSRPLALSHHLVAETRLLRNRGSERLSDLVGVARLVSGSARTGSQVF